MRSNQAKHKTAPKGSPIFRRAIVVMLTLALSIACYGVTVFAWFQAEVLNTGNTITSGTYSLAVTVVEKVTNTSVQETNGSFALTAGKGYTVTITAEGTTNGYCKISNGTDTWNTEAISVGKTFTLTIYPTKAVNYTFTTVWGAPQNDEKLIPDNYQIGKPPAESQEEPEVPVEEGITQPGDDVTNPTETDPTTAPTEGETTAPTEEPTTTPTEEPTPTETVTETTQPTVQETPAEGEQ